VEGSKGKFSKRDSVYCSNVVLGNTVGQVYTPTLTTGLSCEQFDILSWSPLAAIPTLSLFVH
jgi:hypothetical protein